MGNRAGAAGKGGAIEVAVRKKENISRKSLFWAGMAIGAKREREKQMSGTRAPEVQKEIDLEAAAARQNAAVQMRWISERNQEKGYSGDVHLGVMYTDGCWYLKLEEGNGRVVSFSHEDLSVALEEIFR